MLLVVVIVTQQHVLPWAYDVLISMSRVRILSVGRYFVPQTGACMMSGPSCVWLTVYEACSSNLIFLFLPSFFLFIMFCFPPDSAFKQHRKVFDELLHGIASRVGHS